MIVREPVVAGRFYPAHPDRCLADLASLLGNLGPVGSISTRFYGGIVPHAGWAFSGAVAARVFRMLADAANPDVIVLFGSVHRYTGRRAALFSSGRWETPIGPVDVDERLAERLLGQTNLLVADVHAHTDEHSIEVQMPFVKHLFPAARVLPIMVPPTPDAHEVGEAVARALNTYIYKAIVVGTTDLTHYGPQYGFVPHGIGPAGNRWAKDVNDQRFIDLVCDLKAEHVVAEAAEHRNACSAGAVAASLRATLTLGASEATLVARTTSADILASRGTGGAENSVGYAGFVFS